MFNRMNIPQNLEMVGSERLQFNIEYVNYFFNKFTSPIFAHLLCLKVVAAWLTSNIFLTWFSDLLQGNIQRLTVQQLDAYKAHSWLLSPPCQPYTRQGFHIFSLFWQFLNSNDLLLLPDTWGLMLLESHDKAVDVVLIFFCIAVLVDNLGRALH